MAARIQAASVFWTQKRQLPISTHSSFDSMLITHTGSSQIEYRDGERGGHKVLAKERLTAEGC